MKYIVCFDIGGTNVKYAVLNTEGQIIEKDMFQTNIYNGNDVLEQMCHVIEDYKAHFDVVGITISSPGFVNTKTGTIESGNIIEGFNGLNIKEYFSQKYDILVTVENDANCATIAEHTLGNGKGYENIVCLTIGTGVGGGIIINNKIYNGNKFMAGEFGFMFVNGINSFKPEDDILSNYASTRSLVEKTTQDLNRPIDGLEIFNLAKSGDAVCQRNIEKFYDHLAMAIYNLCYILNPDKVLIGGAVSQQNGLIEAVKKRIDDYTPSFSQKLTDFTQIEKCKYLNDAGLMGSYCNFITQYR